MKRKILAVTALFIIALSFCNGQESKTANNAGGKAGTNTPTRQQGITEIKETMFITQINDIYLNYETYRGKTIKMEGMFKHYQWEGNNFYVVYRRAPGCCGDDGEVGFEVSWNPNYKGSDYSAYKGKLPERDAWVEVKGELKEYENHGQKFLYLVVLELNVLAKRGAEFVRR